MDDEMSNSRVFSRPPDKDELALGYAKGEDNEGEFYQMKGVPQSERGTHFYIVGASRTGKTKLIEYMILQDIKNGAGFAVIDPHGDLIESVKELLVAHSKESLESVLLIDPMDKENSVAFNPLELQTDVQPSQLASELTQIFKKIWADAWGARTDEIFRNTLVALIEGGATLGQFYPMLSDSAVRATYLQHVKNEECRQFFEKYEAWDKKMKLEYTNPILNKVSAFLSDERVRDILVPTHSSFNIRNIMDEGKIVLVKLDKGRLQGASELLGSLILSKMQMAAFSRTDIPMSQRKQFYVYIDEFQNFAEETFKDVLAEAAKYKYSLILAHQNLAQLPTQLRASILGNCNLQAYFRVGRIDAELLAKEAFAGVYETPPKWEQYFAHLQTFPNRNCLVRNASQGGIIMIRVPNLPPQWESLGLTPEEFDVRVREAHIGENYLRSRKEIAKDYEELLSRLHDQQDNFKEMK